MSIEVVKKQVHAFLKKDDPEVLSIKGDWGVGKTFTWKQYLSQYKSDISLNRYSYVSLFGINSIDDLKFAIFENIIKKELIGKEANLDTFKENTLSLFEKYSRKSSGFFSKNPITKGFAPALESISFFSLNKVLICLDDLERKGNKLEVKEILGLVSLLKEQKGCKVVFLLNDNEEGIEDYRKYREKVIDIELEFSPSPEECAETAFNGNDWLTNTLKELSLKLKIRNIRVLKKIQRLAKELFVITKEYEVEVKYQAIHSLVLFSWCFYCSKDNEDTPSLDYTTGRGYRSLGLGDKEEKSSKNKAWDSILRHYKYFVTDELDLEIKQAVMTGYFIEESVKERANSKNREVIASKAEGSFTKAWELYHYSLESNKDEVISALYSSLERNAEYISPMNLNGTVTLFRELGEDQKANEIIDIYIDKRKGTPAIFNLDDFHSNPFSSDIQDAEIRKKFKATWIDAFEEENPSDVIERLSKINGWSQSDIVCLEKLSTDEFYTLLKNINGKSLSMSIDAVRRIGSYTLQQNEDSSISKNLMEALSKIGNESEINKRRIKRYGVELE
jgi:hypothetical protein